MAYMRFFGAVVLVFAGLFVLNIVRNLMAEKMHKIVFEKMVSYLRENGNGLRQVENMIAQKQSINLRVLYMTLLHVGAMVIFAPWLALASGIVTPIIIGMIFSLILAVRFELGYAPKIGYFCEVYEGKAFFRESGCKSLFSIKLDKVGVRDDELACGTYIVQDGAGFFILRQIAN